MVEMRTHIFQQCSHYYRDRQSPYKVFCIISTPITVDIITHKFEINEILALVTSLAVRFLINHDITVLCSNSRTYILNILIPEELKNQIIPKTMKNLIIMNKNKLKTAWLLFHYYARLQLTVTLKLVFCVTFECLFYYSSRKPLNKKK